VTTPSAYHARMGAALIEAGVDQSEPVDEDAAAEARAYERGRADERADVLLYMRAYEQKALKLADETDPIADAFKYACRATVAETLNATAEGLETRAADQLATKQGAVSK
jgi:hypothetical protein